MKRRTKIGLIVLVVATAPWWLNALYLGGALLYGRIDEVRYAPTTRFDAGEWQKPNMKYRYAVLNTVAANVVTQGMTEATLTQLLGKPDMIDTNGNWQFEAKRPGWRLIDFSGGGLHVQFGSNRAVEKATINTWVD